MNKPKILLVDDEESIRLSVKYALEDWFDITTVTTTKEMFELLRNHTYDLILLDVMITEEGAESGIDALKVINKEYPKMTVVMITGSVSWMQKKEELEKYGAMAFLSKPFERNDTKNLIEKCLRKN
ncbi:MAG: response regulator [Actinobacteria bacterium]|nr:response regulator [Actinomycetota bacterium]